MFLADLDRAVVRGALEHSHYLDPSTVVGREKGLLNSSDSEMPTEAEGSSHPGRTPDRATMRALKKWWVFGEMFGLSTGFKQESNPS